MQPSNASGKHGCAAYAHAGKNGQQGPVYQAEPVQAAGAFTDGGKNSTR